MQILSVLFFAAIGIQLLFIIVFLIAHARKRGSSVETHPPVSVIVCAHDEEENLRELIPLLLSQEYAGDFEIIIVNDRSNDGTYDLLLEETKKNTALKMVQVDRVPSHANGKKYGLTLGIKAAAHEWILLTDADCRPADSHWIARMSENFVDQASFVIGLSPYKKTSGFLNLFIRFESWITAIQYLAFALLKNPYMGVGRNLAYRKSLFLEKKGFNQFLGVTGGDDDLFVNQHARGNNIRAEFNPESLTISLPKRTWSAFFRQKVRHLSVGKHYRLKHRILLGTFGLTWILTWAAAIALLGIDYTQWWVGALLFFRVIMIIILLNTVVKKAKLTFEWWAVPFLDFIYSIYYLSTGVVALSTKKVQWTK